jgi:hypothetical protein
MHVRLTSFECASEIYIYISILCLINGEQLHEGLCHALLWGAYKHVCKCVWRSYTTDKQIRPISA